MEIAPISDRLNWKNESLVNSDRWRVGSQLPEDIKNYLIDIDGTICDDTQMKNLNI